MSIDCDIGCIGWRRVGIVIGCLIFIPNSVWIYYVSNIDPDPFEPFTWISWIWRFTFLYINWWMILGWIGATITYRHVLMLGVLIFWGFLLALEITYICVDYAADIGYYKDDRIDYLVGIAVFSILYGFCILSYFDVKRKAIDGSRYCDNQLSTVVYVYSAQDDSFRTDAVNV